MKRSIEGKHLISGNQSSSLNMQLSNDLKLFLTLLIAAITTDAAAQLPSDDDNLIKITTDKPIAWSQVSQVLFQFDIPVDYFDPDINYLKTDRGHYLATY